MSEEARVISKFEKLKNYYEEHLGIGLNIEDGQFVVYKNGSFIHKFDTITSLEFWLSGFANGYKSAIKDYMEDTE